MNIIFSLRIDLLGMILVLNSVVVYLFGFKQTLMDQH